jgi:hypothetical protein
MSHIKFNHVFAFLMILAAVSAFAIPRRYTDKALPQVQSVFTPVSYPVRKAAASVHARVAPRDSADRRDAEDVKTENQRLRERVIELDAQLDWERKRNAQWATLGKLRDQCLPVEVEVAGNDAGTRDSLALSGSTLEHVRDNAVALYAGGVAGQIQGRAGIAGAQLRLVTDRGFRVRGYFVRMSPDLVPQKLTQTVLFEGVGGAMVVRPPLSERDVANAGLRPGDLAVADEREWPPELVGRALGAVTKIERKRDAAGFSETRIEPSMNLMMLDEVMVMKK